MKGDDHLIVGGLRVKASDGVLHDLCVPEEDAMFW